jgi:hypothetical protein
MKKIIFAIAVLSFVFSSCKKYKRDNQYDTEYELDRNVSISLTSSIVYESIATDGKVQDMENVYFKVTVKNNGPDVAYFTDFMVQVPGSFVYDTYPDQDNVYDMYYFTAANPHGLKGFIAPGETATLNWSTVSNVPYSIKMYAFSSSPPATNQTMKFILFDAKGKEYSFNIPFTTL